MKLGTKSVLYGAHAFWYHPIAVACGWWHLYGFPWDPRLWAAFFLHDIGYFGKRAMDDEDGETHPLLGARIMCWLFDTYDGGENSTKWYEFCLFHSRYYAKKLNSQPSKLCMADKLAPLYTPAWLYVACTRLSGELVEYMRDKKTLNINSLGADNWKLMQSEDPYDWYAGLRGWGLKYATEHKNGEVDLVTTSR